MNKVIKFGIGLLFSGVGLIYAFRQFNWTEFISLLQEVNYWYLLGAIALQLAAVWVRALRWKWLLAPIKNIAIKPLFNATMIGYFGNNVLPLRMGELLRAYVVANNSSISTSKVLGTLIVERMLDVIGVVILAIIFLFFFDIINIPNWFIIGLILITILLFGILWIISNKKHDWESIKRGKNIFSSKIGSKIYDIIKNLVAGISVINKMTNKIGVYGLIIVLWGMYYLSFIFIVKSVNLGLNWVDSGVLFLLLSLAISIPAAPGYIGTYHAAGVGALTTIYNIGLSESQAFVVLSHAVVFVPFVTIGAIFFLTNSMKFSKLKSLGIIEP